MEEGVLKTLTYTIFTTKLKRTLDLCGYDSSPFSGHYFRRGALPHLPCIATCLAIILSYKVTGNRLHMSVT